jgi:hypothetical protein
MPDAIIGPDDLSQWEAAPPAARARGAPELIRVFDTAEAALAFLAQRAEGSPKAAPLRPARGWKWSRPVEPGTADPTLTNSAEFPKISSVYQSFL